MLERCVAWNGSPKESGYSAVVFNTIEAGILTPDNAGIVVYGKDGGLYMIENCSKFRRLILMQRISYWHHHYGYLGFLISFICAPWLMYWAIHTKNLSVWVPVVGSVLFIAWIVLMALLSEIEMVEYLCIRKEHAVQIKQ